MQADVERYRAFIAQAGGNRTGAAEPPLINPSETEFLSNADDLIGFDLCTTAECSHAPPASDASRLLVPLLAALTTRFVAKRGGLTMMLLGLICAMVFVMAIVTALLGGARWTGKKNPSTADGRESDSLWQDRGRMRRRFTRIWEEWDAKTTAEWLVIFGLVGFG